MKALFRAVLVLTSVGVSLLALLSLVIWLRYGGGKRFEDRTSAPMLSAANIETVIDLALPPGNVAVSGDGRVFFTLLRSRDQRPPVPHSKPQPAG